jgi:uncharacterized delta-60 repeat protein
MSQRIQPLRIMLAAGSALLALLAPLSAAHAAAGDLDPTFATGGVYMPPAECCAISRADAVVVQPDGKAVMAGYAYGGVNGEPEAVVARINLDGSLDTSFAIAGVRRISLSTANTYAQAVALQGDGKIVIAGGFSDGANRAFVARLDTAGNLDATFGVNGVRTIASHTGSELAAEPRAVVVQADGKVVIAGTLRYPAFFSEMFATRLDANGAVDTSFGTNGTARPGLGDSTNGFDAAITSAGAIILVGDVNNSAGKFAAAVRFTATGALDASFDGDGVKAPLLGANGLGRAVAILPDGRIAIAGRANNRPAVYQLLDTGALDTSFSPSGALLFGGSGVASDVVVGIDGFEYALEWTGSDSGPNAHIWRISTAGQADAAWAPDFSVNGGNLGGDFPPRAANLAVGADGSVFAATASMNNFGINTLAYKWSPAGVPNSTFGTSGALHVLGVRYPKGEYNSVLAAADGSLTVMHASSCPPDATQYRYCGRITRLFSNGQRDPALSARLFYVPTASYGVGVRSMMARQSDGRILYVYTGSGCCGDEVWRLARLNADGSADATFGNPELSGGDPPFFTGITGLLHVYPDDRILFASPVAVQRYLPNGQADPSFNLGSVFSDRAHTSAALYANGAFLLGRDSGVMRRDANGLLDTAFGTNGTSTLQIGGYSTSVEQVAIQPDGKIVVAGRTRDSSADVTQLPFLARLTATGALDGSFGVNGVTRFTNRPVVDFLPGLALQPNGKILVAAPEANGGFVARFDANGAADGSFGAGGIATVDPSSGLDTLASLTLAPGGAIVLGGSVNGSGQQPFNVQFGRYAVIKLSGGSQISPSDLIASYYNTILGRAPDPSGSAYWQGEITRMSSLGASVSEVFYSMAAAFFASAEYSAKNTSDAQYVDDLYRTFFDRAADPSGIAYWQSELAAGKPRGAVMNDFMFSTEFANYMANIFGSAATSRAEVSMVMDFYRGLLARLPDTDGLDYWAARFGAAQCNGTVASEADSISSQFIGSGEYGQKLAALPPGDRAAAYVTDLYNAFLKRGGDRAGFLYWVDQINSGARTGEQVRQAFRDLPEFQSRVQEVLAQGCHP